MNLVNVGRLKDIAEVEFPDIVEEAGTHFDEGVRCILDRRFSVKKWLGMKVCEECDLRPYCKNEKLITEHPDSQ